MADDVDRAGAIEAEHLARGLAGIDRSPLPAGAPGECDECGENMPRLVGGRCAFCRDGRRPPLAFYDRTTKPAAPASDVTPAPETQAMPTAPVPVERKISIGGEALTAIEVLAHHDDIPYRQAAAELILQAVKSASAAPAEPATIDLASIDATDLLGALRSRLDQAAMTDDLVRDLAEVTSRAQAAEKRADAAEIKLRLLREALADDGAGA